jgi:hypothetical protein
MAVSVSALMTCYTAAVVGVAVSLHCDCPHGLVKCITSHACEPCMPMPRKRLQIATRVQSTNRQLGLFPLRPPTALCGYPRPAYTTLHSTGTSHASCYPQQGLLPGCRFPPATPVATVLIVPCARSAANWFPHPDKRVSVPLRQLCEFQSAWRCSLLFRIPRLSVRHVLRANSTYPTPSLVCHPQAHTLFSLGPHTVLHSDSEHNTRHN